MGAIKEEFASFSLPAPRSQLQTNIISIFSKFKLSEIAQQITLVEWKFFCKLKPEEFLDGAWLKSSTRTRAPNRT